MIVKKLKKYSIEIGSILNRDDAGNFPVDRILYFDWWIAAQLYVMFSKQECWTAMILKNRKTGKVSPYLSTGKWFI